MIYDDGGFARRESHDDAPRGKTGIRHGWTMNNMLRGDEEPGHFPEDELPEDDPCQQGQEIEE